MIIILITMLSLVFFFFFNDTATTEIYTLSLHDALPIYLLRIPLPASVDEYAAGRLGVGPCQGDRKSTRLNSSHSQISYAVFCLKKKNTDTRDFLAIRSNVWDADYSLAVTTSTALAEFYA